MQTYILIFKALETFAVQTRNMKALSLKQPFAELIVGGKKTIELRKWNTNFRGEFFVHASLNTKKEWLEKYGFKELPQGCIVGKARLVDVKKYKNKEELEADADKHCAGKEWWSEPTYGFILKNAQRLDSIPLKGKLNFFDVDLDQKELKNANPH